MQNLAKALNLCDLQDLSPSLPPENVLFYISLFFLKAVHSKNVFRYALLLENSLVLAHKPAISYKDNIFGALYSFIHFYILGNS